MYSKKREEAYKIGWNREGENVKYFENDILYVYFMDL